MSELNAPEWSGPFTTGLFGTAYGFDGGRSLVLLGAPGIAVGDRPDRTWPWIVMKGRAMDWVRDLAFEEQLRTNEKLARITGIRTIDGDRLFTVQETDVATVFRILKEAARAGSGSRPGQKAAL